MADSSLCMSVCVQCVCKLKTEIILITIALPPELNHIHTFTHITSTASEQQSLDTHTHNAHNEHSFEFSSTHLDVRRIQ